MTAPGAGTPAAAAPGRAGGEVTEEKPSWDDAVGMLEEQIAEQARTIDDYRNEVTRLMGERDDWKARYRDLMAEANQLTRQET